MSVTVADLSPKTRENAGRQFVELYGSPLVWNTYLKIALLVVSVIALGLLALVFATQARYADLKPLVIRIDSVGRAEAVSYDAASQYQPQAPELRYFLTRFIVMHFGRIRATLQRDFSESLFFLEPVLQASTWDSLRQRQVFETFLKNAAAEEIDIVVKNVVLSELTTQPFKAAVDFDQHYYTVGTRAQSKQETYIASIDFTMAKSVPSSYVPVNPLGLQVLRLRVDPAF